MKLPKLRLTALALAAAGAANAQSSVIEPLTAATFNIIVAVQDNATFTPAQLIESVKTSGRSRTIPSANGAIGARLTFGDLGDVSTTPPASALRDMARYVTLSFPALMLRDSTTISLDADAAFGYVGLQSKGGFSARTPNDAFYFRQWQWGSAGLSMPNAWEYSTGTRLLGLMDMPPDINFEATPNEGQRGHEDLTNHFARNFAGNFWYVSDANQSGYVFTSDEPLIHGTHVAGLLSAKTNNVTGVAGGCWGCRIALAPAGTAEARGQASNWLADSGVSIINLSGFISDATTPTGYAIPVGTPCSNFPASERHPFCAVISVLEQRDTILVAASGNDRRPLNFPANDPRVVAVGGTQPNGQLWDEGPNCVPNYTDFPGQECGSNFGPEQDFVAPAKLVYSTVSGTPYSTGVCGDPSNPNALYGTCTGTSMSTPIVSATLGILRSVNPLLYKNAVIGIMKQTASNGSFPNSSFGSGVPNTALAIERILGRSADKQVENRLTPAFALEIPASSIGTTTGTYVNSSTSVTVTPDRLYTTQPNVALAAYGQGNNSNGGVYLSRPGRRQKTRLPYQFQAQGAQSIPQYVIPNPSLFFSTPLPKAAFALFTTRRNPFDNSAVANVAADEALMKPLYKMSFSAPCDFRDHLYTTDLSYAISIESVDACANFPLAPNLASTYPKPHSFRVDDIEGFVLSSCPAGYTCNNSTDPTEPQMLYQLSIPGTSDRALVMEGDRAKPAYAAYVNADAEPLGYVMPYIDSDYDGLIDGFERILGTHPLAFDSDCDGQTDTVEYPIAGVQAQYADPAVGTASCADRSVQVTGAVLTDAATTRDLEHIVTLKNNYGPTFGTTTSVTLNWNNEDGSKIGAGLPLNWNCNSVGARQEVCTGPTPAIGASVQLSVRTRRNAQNNAAVGTVVVGVSTSDDPILSNNSAQWNAPIFVAANVDAALSYNAVRVNGKYGAFTTTHTFTVSTPKGSYAPSAQLEISNLVVAMTTVPAGWTCQSIGANVRCTTASMQPASSAVFSVSLWNSGTMLQYNGSALLTGFADPNLSNNQVTNITF
jgi:hypothetical protein